MSNKLLALCSLILCMSSYGWANEPPNLVFIIADDLGWADVQFHGGNAPTPNLDRLRQQGAELTQHYVAPVCSPTRAGFLTGRYWSRFGITTPINNRGLAFDTVTVARALTDVGYETALIGKWHLGSKPEWGPNHFGFGHSYGSLAGGVTPWNHFYKKGPYSTTWHRNEKLLEEQGHVTDLLADEAVDWIQTTAKENKDSPFFLYVPFTAVHLPIREPEEWLARVPEGIHGTVERQYAACIMHLDDAVRRIVDAVDAAGEAENTLIVFTSDNGGSTAQNNDTKYPDDGCPNGRLPGNNAPLRGQKGTLYEGGIRVPTIVRWPGTISAGGQIEQPACVVDWMPTFCRLAGFDSSEVAPSLDGIDLSPILRGETQSEQSERVGRSIYVTGPRGKKWVLRHGDWKLIVRELADAKRTTELFNLANDPVESTDLSATAPEKVTQLLELWKAQRASDIESRGGL